MASVDSYSNAAEFLADPENDGIDAEAYTKFLDCEEAVQELAMARGNLSTAKDKGKALLYRIANAKYDVAIARGEEPPPDAKKGGKRKSGDEPMKKAEIDIDLVQPGANAKTELTSYLQHKLGRAMEKGDVTFNCEGADGSGWTATLVLPCLEGETMVGEIGETSKKAEQNVAKAFLESRREDILEMNLDSRPLVVRERSEGGEPRSKRPRTSQPAGTMQKHQFKGKGGCGKGGFGKGGFAKGGGGGDGMGAMMPMMQSMMQQMMGQMMGGGMGGGMMGMGKGMSKGMGKSMGKSMGKGCKGKGEWF